MVMLDDRIGVVVALLESRHARNLDIHIPLREEALGHEAMRWAPGSIRVMNAEDDRSLFIEQVNQECPGVAELVVPRTARGAGDGLLHVAPKRREVQPGDLQVRCM